MYRGVLPSSHAQPAVPRSSGIRVAGYRRPGYRARVLEQAGIGRPIEPEVPGVRDQPDPGPPAETEPAGDPDLRADRAVPRAGAPVRSGGVRDPERDPEGAVLRDGAGQRPPVAADRRDARHPGAAHAPSG